MRRVLPVLLALALAPPAAAQEQDPDAGSLPEPQGETEAMPEPGTGRTAAAVQAPGAVVRWLDKVTGQSGDWELRVGQAGRQGRITVGLDDCRYSGDGVATAAFAHLTVTDDMVADTVFSGWMSAQSPALSAMDHARYDVWVLRCLTE
jgi:hypothetical protein